MTTVAKFKTNVEKRAEIALNVYRDYTDLAKIIDENKIYFRELADGETVTHEVAGLGKIQVKKPSEGGLFTSTSFSVDAFNALDKKVQHELISKGVVKITTSSKAPSQAAVVFTLNV